MSMWNDMCNPGSVNIPWYAAMQPDHPFFGFLIVRESGGRMQQINDWSYLKHAFASANVNGSCGICVHPGTSSVMGVNCSDAYWASNNADREWLGPPDELDPWLGIWNPIGSYFDRGDPPVSGSAATDGQRSLVTTGWDSVKNRVTVQEGDLLVPGANYFYGIHLVHRGEAASNRVNNLASRGFDPTWSGGGWSFVNNSAGQVHGSILQHWAGATLDSNRNGNDDGTFYVAVNVTALGGGQYHYEYAVHNADNNRGGASLRVPLSAGAAVTAIGFDDIDDNPLNDWSGSVVGSEIVWSAPLSNPHNWNTIYNFWFDCDVPPSQGTVLIDQARVGPGQLSVAVPARVPSGVASAFVVSVGDGCGDCFASFYETFPNTGTTDLVGSSMSLTLTPDGYQVAAGSGSFQQPGGPGLGLGDDAETTVQLPFTLPYPGGSTDQLTICSNGFVSVGIGNGISWSPTTTALMLGLPRWSPLWTDLDPSAAGQVVFEATNAEVRLTWLDVPSWSSTLGNTFQIRFQSNGDVDYYWLQIGGESNGYLVGWSVGGVAADPGPTDLSAELGAGFLVCNSDQPGLTFAASSMPVVGTAVGLVSSNIPPGSPFGATALSLTEAVPPQDLTSLGMPGCEGYLVGQVVQELFVSPGVAHTSTLLVPNDQSLLGLVFAGQSFTYSPPLTPIGVISSNGLVFTVGAQ